jgi:uncharacterized protein (DUF488 family)
MAREGPTILTIGHSNRTLDDFVTLLRAHDVELVADVRRFPGSRRYPHFNRESLSQALPAHGSAYLHFPELGGRRKAVPDSPNSTWRNEMFRGYADYMETEEFRTAIDALMAEAENRRTAIMCAEALWWQCHRSMMADYLKAVGWRVLHILGTEKTEEHRYTDPARIVEGRLTYHALEQPHLALHSHSPGG